MDRPETSEAADNDNIKFDNYHANNLDEPDSVVSPTSADANVVARFEFDSQQESKGTRVLMVEWDCVDASEPPAEKCDVTWDGKPKVLSVADCEATSTRRLYYLLSPLAPIPGTISINRPGLPTLHAKPLPAIFTPGLATGADAPDPGLRGVLHTIFAKLSISQLDAEIAKEAGENTESVAIDMANKEKEFLEDYFGVGDKKAGKKDGKPVLEPLATSPTTAPPIHPATQASPISMRMSEQLKGLKLATSPEGLAAAATEAHQQQKAKPIQPPGLATQGLVPIAGMTPMNSGSRDDDDGDDDGEELFALPMSPRSPEMKKSPFSLLT